MATKKDAFIILRVTSALKAKLEKLAKKEGLTLSKFVRLMLETAI